MLIRIITARQSKYSELEKKYGRSSEIIFSRSDSPEPNLSDSGDGICLESGAERRADIVIADPEFLRENSFSAASIRNRASAEHFRFIIGDPERMKSLERELAAAGVMHMDNDEEEADSCEDEAAALIKRRLTAGITGLADGSGAGFVTMILAEELASELFEAGGLVSVYAPGDRYFYRALQLDRRFPDGSFRDISKLIRKVEKRSAEETVSGAEDDEERIAVNEDEGICSAAACEDSVGTDPDMRASFVNRLDGVFVLRKYTCSEFREEYRSAAQNMDVLIAVLDPLPSKMKDAEEMLALVKACGVPVIYVVNRMTRGTESSRVLSFLETYDAVFLPCADYGTLCRCENIGVNPYRDENIRRQLMDPLCGIVDRIREAGGAQR